MHANTKLVCDYIVINYKQACKGYEYDLCQFIENGMDVLYASRHALAQLIRWAEFKAGVPSEEWARKDLVMATTGIHNIMGYDLDHLYT